MKKNESYDVLKLENQLCFPLYAASHKIVRQYKEQLDELDLTYTQYVTMMLLWEMKSMTVKEVGGKLFLDSGTLTPLLKKLEGKGYIKRERSSLDERSLVVSITEAGEALKEEAKAIPEKMASCTGISPEEAKELYRILYKILAE